MSEQTATPEVKRKMKFKAKVLKTTLAGAIVDIGLDKPGIIHIAHLSAEPIKRVEDVVNVGDEVNVWVRRLHPEAKHYDLTMIEPLPLEWREIKKGMTVKGQVVRTEKFGAFIEIGAERPGLAHISELTHDYIRSTEDAVKVGDEVEAKIIDFNRRKKQIKLSLKAMREPPAEELEEAQEDQEPALTAMEIAYRKAIADEEGEYWDEVNVN
jgi:ribosomal protein S1